MATKIRHETKGATGSDYQTGHFNIKLNLALNRYLELGERFHLILTREPIPNDDSIIISDYTELEKSQWLRTLGSKSYFDKIAFRIPLTFKADRDDKGYAECSILCWAFNAKYMAGRYATLVYDRIDSRDIGIPLFRNEPLATLYNLNIRLRKAEEELKQKEKRDALRVIFWPSAWQPEVEFGGDADLHLWRLPDPLPMIDSHLHIQSNHCAPLPLVWDKLPYGLDNVFKFLKVGWDTQMPDKKWLIGGVIGAAGALIAAHPLAVFAIGGLITDQIRQGKIKIGMDKVAGLKFGESGRIGGNRTVKIGIELGKILDKANTWNLPFFSNAGPTVLCTPLPMDMHYGHFHGYHGEPIYTLIGGKLSFRLSPFSAKRTTIEGENSIIYEKFDVQVLDTITSAMAKPWQILPLYHYDPRRWTAKAEVPKSWDIPFGYVNSSSHPAKVKSSPFIAFKTYTSLGYMPLDPALPHQTLFYDECEKRGIPIMNHCTTAGMYTHDKPFYYDLWKSDPNLKDKHTLDSEIESLEQRLLQHIQQLRYNIVDLKWKDDEKELLLKKVTWFDKHYVYPSAWEPVVAKRKTLKICLAHFCGYDFFGTKKVGNGKLDEETGLIHGFPVTEPGGFPEKNKTNPLIYDLCKLVRKDNQIHFDVSFFFITEYNREAVLNFYNWAKTYQGGFILDRMLWGSDWPLLATDSSKGKYLKENQMKGYVDMNSREWMNIDPELWFRMAVINPMRFYNIKELIPHLKKIYAADSNIKSKEPPVAILNPALSMAEIYSNRKPVVG